MNNLTQMYSIQFNSIQFTSNMGKISIQLTNDNSCFILRFLFIINGIQCVNACDDKCDDPLTNQHVYSVIIYIQIIIQYILQLNQENMISTLFSFLLGCSVLILSFI